jgi:trehalose-6-phosphate synthase
LQTQLSQFTKKAISVRWSTYGCFFLPELTLMLVWVNDYHLMLVPQLVREKLPTAIIGYFMHVAFPSSEIFRCLSAREHLLRGMLSADLIGFQTANFARHFRQTVSRILALETLPKGIQLDDHFVDVGVFPVGIDVRALKEKRLVMILFSSWVL